MKELKRPTNDRFAKCHSMFWHYVYNEFSLGARIAIEPLWATEYKVSIES